MAWIESHQTIWEHAKTRKAARRLAIPTVQLVGHLHALWHWALDHAESGDVSKYEAEDLAIAARWEGDPEAFVAALVDCGPGHSAGYLERGGVYGPPDDECSGELVLHDWWQYAGKLIERRERDRVRKARLRGNPEDVRETSAGRPQDAATPSDGAPRPPPPPTTPPTPSANQPDQPDPTASPSRKRADRATRLPDGWEPDPDPEREAEAVAAGVDVRRELERFGDYWRAQPGARGRKVDWQATWRNWLRKAVDDQPRRNGHARASPAPSRGARYAAAWDGLADQLEAAERGEQ